MQHAVKYTPNPFYYALKPPLAAPPFRTNVIAIHLPLHSSITNVTAMQLQLHSSIENSMTSRVQFLELSRHVLKRRHPRHPPKRNKQRQR